MSIMVAEQRCSTTSAETAEYVQRVREQPSELPVEEWNLLPPVYKNAVGNRRAAWRVITSVKQKETSKGDEQLVSNAREYVEKVEGELQKIRDGILTLMDKMLVPSASTGESKEKGSITCVINRLQTPTDLKGFDMVIGVRWLAEQEQTAALAQLGSHISAIMKFGADADDDPFVKVKDLIMELIRLQEETSPEAYCDEETSMAAEKEDLEDDTAKHSSPLETAVPNSTESVNEGHPDKICDQFPAAVLDACLTCDTKCKVANETCVKDNMFMVTGEITVAGKHETVVRGVIPRQTDQVIDVPVVLVVQVPWVRVVAVTAEVPQVTVGRAR